MSRCRYTEECPFFTAGVGYSPGLFEVMRDRYCLGDESMCARLLAIEILGRENVPDEMLPSDHEMLERIKDAAGVDGPSASGGAAEDDPAEK